jgi:multiple sugar transport system ATP-binding protein
VAGFIGNPPMNFVAATATQDGVFEAMGMRLAGPKGHATLTMGVRPEDMAPGENGLQCRIAVLEPLGAHTLATAFVSEKKAVFRAAMDSSGSYQQGQNLSLLPVLNRVRWYDAKGSLIPFTA